MRRRLALVLLVAAAVSLPFAPAASRAQTSTTTSLSEVSWLTGHWVGKTAKGEHIEEMWMADQGGVMIGSFRWQRPDGRWLFEFMQLTGHAGRHLAVHAPHQALQS